MVGDGEGVVQCKPVVVLILFFVGQSGRQLSQSSKVCVWGGGKGVCVWMGVWGEGVCGVNGWLGEGNGGYWCLYVWAGK